MNSFTLFALIFAFGAVEMAKEAKLVATIKIKCGKREATLIETATAPRDNCQGGLTMSKTTMVIEKVQGKVLPAVDNLDTEYTPAAKEGENEVLNAKVTNKKTGEVLDHKDVYPSLNGLAVCGGDKTSLDAKIIGTLKSKDGQTTTCEGTAKIIGMPKIL